MTLIEQFDHNEKTVKIFQDETPEHPRKDIAGWLGTFVASHRRYDLGDEPLSREDVKARYKQVSNKRKYLCLPVYMYDHSGLSLSTTPFSCSWDSGQIGFIYISYQDIQAEWGAMDSATLEKAREVLAAEIATMHQYISGDVYGYVVEDENGQHIDSCWGFYGLDYVREEAKNAA